MILFLLGKREGEREGERGRERERKGWREREEPVLFVVVYCFCFGFYYYCCCCYCCFFSELLRSIGEAGDIVPETESILTEYDIDCEEFPPAVTDSLPLANGQWTIPQVRHVHVL